MLTRRPSPTIATTANNPALALWAGAISGTTVVLFSIGPGTIWPIVLVIAAAITAGAVFGGAFVGFAAIRFRR
jgi:hypothetical protein